MKQFRVRAQIALATSLEISAPSLEDALTKAKEMKVTDFIEIIGDHEDHNFEISGVEKASWLPEIR